MVPAAMESVTLSIYANQEGGTPLWQETQSVTLDERGRYSLLLGAAQTGAFHPSSLDPPRRTGWASGSNAPVRSKAHACV